MARNVLITNPNDCDECNLTFTAEGYVSPGNTAVTLELRHGTATIATVTADPDTGMATHWTKSFTVTDDGDYVLLAYQTNNTQIFHSVSFNVIN